MFGKFMNNYYYGKSGKGDYNPEDLPRTRMQLFWEMLRTRLSALMRLNLIYVLPWIPTLIVIGFFYTQSTSVLNAPDQVDAVLQQINTGALQADGSVVVTYENEVTRTFTRENIETYQRLQAAYDVDDQLMQLANGTVREDGSVILPTGGEPVTRETIDALIAQDEADAKAGIPNATDALNQILFTALLLLIPCIFITGPWTAGVSYVTRNWARDEHAFLWSDMKDAMKVNWKESLVLSAITSVVPVIVYMCWIYYGEMVPSSPVMEILLTMGQMIPVMVGVIWYLAITYAYPMLVTYKMSVMTVIRNSLILAVGRLPQSIGVRLLLCVPVALGVVCALFINTMWAPVILLLYYALFGYTFSRFISASYTNAQFDKFINSRIEGAKVNQGLADVEEDEEEEDEQRPLMPWENGYASQDSQSASDKAE